MRNWIISKNKLYFQILKLTSFKMLYHLSAFYEFGFDQNFQKWAQMDPTRENPDIKIFFKNLNLIGISEGFNMLNLRHRFSLEGGISDFQQTLLHAK